MAPRIIQVRRSTADLPLRQLRGCAWSSKLRSSCNAYAEKWHAAMLRLQAGGSLPFTAVPREPHPAGGHGGNPPDRSRRTGGTASNACKPPTCHGQQVDMKGSKIANMSVAGQSEATKPRVLLEQQDLAMHRVQVQILAPHCSMHETCCAYICQTLAVPVLPYNPVYMRSRHPRHAPCGLSADIGWRRMAVVPGWL
jgi:hypothetical protein